MKLVKIFSAVVFVCLGFGSLSAHMPEPDSLHVKIEEKDFKDSLAVYESRFGQNKIVHDSLKLAFYTALSRYPELWDAHIEIDYQSINSTMQARPRIWSMFSSKKNRKYMVVLNDREGKEKGLSYSKINFEVLVGWFAHEFAHIYSYKDLNTWEMIGFGLKYLISGDFHKTIEREADAMACRRGFSNAIYCGKVLLKTDEDISDAYKARIGSFYLSPAEIKSYTTSH